MGAFSQLEIDISERASKGREEWAVLFEDHKRPATLWRVIGETRGRYFLEHGQRPGVTITRPVTDCWIVI